jgi:dTDP-4-dehydrorhamnose 3,5-epimerase
MPDDAAVNSVESERAHGALASLGSIESNVRYWSQPRKAFAHAAWWACGTFQSSRMNLAVQSLAIAEVKLVTGNRISDRRGYFEETYVRRDFSASDLHYDFVQDNESCSKLAGTLRGLHFQAPPFAQTKLVRVVRGRILDVVVDLRRLSPTFGRHVAVVLSALVPEQLLVPIGFAHGFCTLEPDTLVAYKVDSVYSAAHDRGVNWADPRIAIKWPVSQVEVIMSEKDRALPMLDELPSYFD